MCSYNDGLMSIASAPLLKPNQSPIFHPDKSGWRALATYDKHIQHLIYQCPVYTWLAEGRILINKHISNKRYFLYIEYRNHDGCSQYQVMDFESLEQAVTYQKHNVAFLELPRISPRKSQKHPIKPEQFLAISD